MEERLTAVLRVDDELLAIDGVSVGRVDVLVHTGRAGAAKETSILCNSEGEGVCQHMTGIAHDAGRR